jgi:hypothetical protein
MSEELLAGLVGGLIGGTAGAIGSWLTGYWGPLKLEEQKERRAEERFWGPRKELIKEMLDNAAPGMGRSFDSLRRVTGTPDDDLRRLLVELGAQGFTRENGQEAWDYQHNRPLEKQYLPGTRPVATSG